MPQDGTTEGGGRRSLPPQTKGPLAPGATVMRALVLDGDVVRETTALAEIAAAHAEGKRLWVDIDARTPETDALLADVLHVHSLAVEDIWNDIGLPKVEDFGEYVQIVLHGVLEEDREGNDVPLALSELDVLVGRNFIVTHAHDDRVCAIAPVQLEVGRNARLLRKGPAWVAHAILDRMVDEYLPLVDRFDEQIDEVERSILAGRAVVDDQGTIKRILRIKRSLQMLRRTTIYQREMLLRLARAEFDEIPSEAMPFYRDVYDHFARVTELVDSYRDLVSGLLDAHFSMQSQQMNEVMKRLTVISTIMLPLTLIAGIYGMNFEHMPELKWEHGYFLALSTMACVAGLILFYFRQKRWF